MNFKSISVVLTVLSLNLLALSSPVQNNEISTDYADVSINGVESQNITNDIYLMNKAEGTDISSEEEEEEVILDISDEEVSEIDSSYEDENENVNF